MVNVEHPAHEPAENFIPAAPYEELVASALAAAESMTGWDFSYLRSRTSGGEVSWSYTGLARDLVGRSTSVLDLDTGGGEMLASLRPLPPHAVATESWEANLPVARRTLEPLGVEVRQITGPRLPVASGEFGLVLNRHGTLDVDELWRALAPGGVFFTQQVGSRNDLELNEALGAPPSIPPDSSTCAGTVAALRRKGFRILDAREEFPSVGFHDIAAVVYQLLVVSWTIPGFDVRAYDHRLREVDARIRAEGALVAHNHRYLVKALKPASSASEPPADRAGRGA